MGVIMPAVILVMCFRYTDVMTSVGLIAERVFPIILGLLLLLCFMLVGLYMLDSVVVHDMKWVSVNDYLPPIGIEVLCFRPNSLLDWNDDPLRLCAKMPNGKFTGAHEVTHWLDMDMPPGWTDEHAKRQHS